MPSIGNDHSVAFAQAFEYLDSADRVASEFHRPALSLAAVRGQHKHSDRLLCLTKCRPAYLQRPESLELDRSINAQIGTRARRQRTGQRYVDLEVPSRAAGSMRETCPSIKPLRVSTIAFCPTRMSLI